MAKEKKKSKEDIRDEEAIKWFTNHLKACSKSDINIAQENIDDIDYTICLINFDGYSVKLKLSALIETIEMEYEFIYPDCDIEFSINDIFNVLDINDFGDYFFESNIEDKKSQKNAINEFLSFIAKYDYDIKKAGDSDHLARMCDMHNEDEQIYSNRNVKLKYLIKMGSLENKMRKTKSDKDKKAYINYIKKNEAQYGIDNYTKRYINYLEMGYPIPDRYKADEEEKDLELGKAMLKGFALCLVIGIVISVAVFLIDRFLLMQKGVVSDYASELELLLLFLSGLMGGYVMSRLFTAKIMCALLPDIDKNTVVEYYKNRYKDDDIVRKVFLKYFAPFFASVGFVTLLLCACSSVCITENSIIAHDAFNNAEIQYENSMAYYVKGYTYEDEYYEYEYPCYSFVDKSSEICISTGELKNEKARQYVENAIEKYNITPIVVDEYE